MRLFANNEQLQGIVRQILTFIAGLGAIKGWFDDATGETLIMGGMGVITLILSWNSLDKDTLQEQLLGILRHVVTFLSGVGLLYGATQQETWLSIGSGLVAVFVILWSIFTKRAKVIPINKANSSEIKAA